MVKKEKKNLVSSNTAIQAILSNESLKIGSKVKLKNAKQIGIVSDVKKDKITVVFGAIRTIVNIKDLREA